MLDTTLQVRWNVGHTYNRMVVSSVVSFGILTLKTESSIMPFQLNKLGQNVLWPATVTFCPCHPDEACFSSHSGITHCHPDKVWYSSHSGTTHCHPDKVWFSSHSGTTNCHTHKVWHSSHSGTTYCHQYNLLPLEEVLVERKKMPRQMMRVRKLFES